MKIATMIPWFRHLISLTTTTVGMLTLYHHYISPSPEKVSSSTFIYTNLRLRSHISYPRIRKIGKITLYGNVTMLKWPYMVTPLDSEDSNNSNVSSTGSVNSSMSFISQHNPHQIMNSCEVRYWYLLSTINSLYHGFTMANLMLIYRLSCRRNNS